MSDLQRTADRVAPVVEAIKPYLAGLGPGLQGAVLADLVAISLAGHPDLIREELLALHVESVRKLVPVNEKILFGPAGHPQNEKWQ